MTSKNDYSIDSNFNFIQDVTHIFHQDVDKEPYALSHFIAKMEEKPVKKLPDFNKVFDKLKQCNSENKALSSKLVSEEVYKNEWPYRRYWFLHRTWKKNEINCT